MAIMEAIETVYLEADAASVTFSSIPATYEHLQLRCSLRDAVMGARSSTDLQFNSDTGSNYTLHRIHAYGSSKTAAGWASQTKLYAPNATGKDASSADYSGVVVDILDYANTNKNTSCQFRSYVAGVPDVFFESGLWDDTSAVSTITLTGSSVITRGSQYTLYGIKSS
jgi:hypothetical protein